MTKRYSILQKKLQELELFIKNILSLNPPPDRNLYVQDIEQRLEFLKTLLSAEITSSPEKPHHLRHIGNRLSEIEAILREPPRESCLNDDDHHVETVSTCSCSESCLNDDGEATFEVDLCGFEGKENGLVDVFVEDEKKEEVCMEKEAGELKKEEKEAVAVGGSGWRIWGSFGGGVVIGMVLMGFLMVNLFDCFSCDGLKICYTPT